LDPFSISINFSLGWRLYMARQYDRAIEQLRNTLEMDSSYELAHLVLGQAYEQKSEFDKAIPELRLAVDLSHRAPLMMSALAHAEARAGKRQEAERLLDELSARSSKNYVSPYYLAVAYSGLGKNDQAMEFLGKAFDDRSNGMVFMKVEPLLDTLRPDPRFLALEQKVKLSQ
jgi:tetratricopeptide (TPR) repeat protein